MELWKRHLVSYFTKDDNGDVGFGNAEVVFPHYPPTIDDIKKVENGIRIKLFCDQVCVLGYFPLGEED